MSTLSIFDAARERPNAPALFDGEHSLTFRELAAQAAPLAAALERARPAALELTPRADVASLVWLYAAFASGTPVLTLHTRAGEAERRHARALVGSAPADPSCLVPTQTGDIFSPPTPADPPSSSNTSPPARLAAPAAPLVYIPTSGSTGTPRVVELSRAAVIASAHASAANLGWQDDDRWLLCLPLAHTGGLSIVVRCLLARRPLILFEAGPGGALARIADLRQAAEQATLISLVPSLLAALLDASFTGQGRLRALLLGGASCSPALARRAHAAGIPLLTSYGLTETASQVVTRRYTERFEPLPERAGYVSSGHPLPGVELRLRPDGELIELRTPALFTRYVGDARASLAPDGWLATNDRAELGPDGELYVLGRADDVIVTAGENVDPLEVEAALCALPGVQAACVFGTASTQFGQVVTALLVPADPETHGAQLSDPEALGRLLADRLARHKWPRRVLCVETLPLTAAGKVDRRECAARWASSPSALQS